MIVLIMANRRLVVFLLFFFLGLKFCLSVSRFYETLRLQREEKETLLFFHQQPEDVQNQYGYYHWLLYSHHHPFTIGGGHDDSHHRGRNCVFLYVSIRLVRALWRRAMEQSGTTTVPKPATSPIRPASSFDDTNAISSAKESENTKAV
jgi:hypothetical protein